MLRSCPSLNLLHFWYEEGEERMILTAISWSAAVVFAVPAAGGSRGDRKVNSADRLVRWRLLSSSSTWDPSDDEWIVGVSLRRIPHESGDSISKAYIGHHNRMAVFCYKRCKSFCFFCLFGVFTRTLRWMDWQCRPRTGGDFIAGLPHFEVF